MQNTVRTIYASYLQSCLTMGLPHTVAQYTTLNEKLGIQAGQTLTPGTYPKLKYFAIGVGGHSMTMGADNIPLATINQHKATDAALFKQTPFVLRQVGNDLSSGERARYALRRTETHAGTTYIAYYLKRIVMDNVISQMEYRTINNGIVTSTPFIPTADNLNPTPVVINNSGVNVVSGDYVTATTLLPIDFTAADIEELINVAIILHGDENYAIISEMAVCSGADKVISVTNADSTTFNFNEAIGVQINTHVSTMKLAKYSNTGISMILSLGSNDPLFNIVGGGTPVLNV